MCKRLAPVITRDSSIGPRGGGAVSALRLAADPVVREGEGVVETQGIGAAGLREIGPASAAATHNLGHLLDELTRLEALREVLGDGGDEIHLAVDDAADGHDAGA